MYEPARVLYAPPVAALLEKKGVILVTPLVALEKLPFIKNESVLFALVVAVLTGVAITLFETVRVGAVIVTGNVAFAPLL